MDLIQAIDDMPGPEFLLLYAGVILATLAICRVWAGRQDPTRHLPTPPVPDDVDPLEIVLTEAAWIPDDGPFHKCLRDGTVLACEPAPGGGDSIIGRTALIDAYPWHHPLPREVQ